MISKYTAGIILKVKNETCVNGGYKTPLESETDAQIIAEILSLLGKQNLAINHASAILDDCNTLLGVFGTI